MNKEMQHSIKESNQEWTVCFPYIFDEVIHASSQDEALDIAVDIISTKFVKSKSPNLIDALRNSNSIQVTQGRHSRIRKKELSTKIEDIKKRLSLKNKGEVSIGEGWFQLVIDCDSELSALDDIYVLLGIRDNSGRLEYIVEASSEDYEIAGKLQEIISKYQEIALRTCSATGKPGVLMKASNGYFKVLNQQYVAKNPDYSRAGYSLVEQQQQ
jgi:hypothetical protein